MHTDHSSLVADCDSGPFLAGLKRNPCWLEHFNVQFLGSVEVPYHQGNGILCAAMQKVTAGLGVRADGGGAGLFLVRSYGNYSYSGIISRALLSLPKSFQAVGMESELWSHPGDWPEFTFTLLSAPVAAFPKGVDDLLGLLVPSGGLTVPFVLCWCKPVVRSRGPQK